ncbi:hypothetical protein MKW98_008323 [Papaver atlanticum]|uniref:Small ribosomal subunit protein uS15c n=1 Tax=Papaver atlanticum TaxID=357466 RepID=A0AAD4XXD2_9MAGN|nr:hypothetical protein MKW98_008323 [Papaver atlanticum]
MQMHNISIFGGYRNQYTGPAKELLVEKASNCFSFMLYCISYQILCRLGFCRMKELGTIHSVDIINTQVSDSGIKHQKIPVNNLQTRVVCFHMSSECDCNTQMVATVTSEVMCMLELSDCGSSRVQVAQLTTKIKHLSSVLHKKDKHSRKGLVAMVQRRKKILRYLRRTDWDSYCQVLSQLGMRDNPDYKH